ncbi:hypothetical protein FGF80_15845 [Natrinema pallidum]|uniref:Uncharacterized protein n=1 Tax=Natrinema pallidum TaxID=69527 RepID=A0A4P9TI62_9EURY|nr:hypothetical protein FGF80_15845 [Natrinema pallidum]
MIDNRLAVLQQEDDVFPINDAVDDADVQIGAVEEIVEFAIGRRRPSGALLSTSRGRRMIGPIDGRSGRRTGSRHCGDRSRTQGTDCSENCPSRSSGVIRHTTVGRGLTDKPSGERTSPDSRVVRLPKYTRLMHRISTFRGVLLFCHRSETLVGEQRPVLEGGFGHTVDGQLCTDIDWRTGRRLVTDCAVTRGRDHVDETLSRHAKRLVRILNGGSIVAIRVSVGETLGGTRMAATDTRGPVSRRRASP